MPRSGRLAQAEKDELVPSSDQPRRHDARQLCEPYIDQAEAHNGAAPLVPVALFIPGCPPHPYTILDGLLRLLGRSG